MDNQQKILISAAAVIGASTLLLMRGSGSKVKALQSCILSID
jgi:hypothetical protein